MNVFDHLTLKNFTSADSLVDKRYLAKITTVFAVAKFEGRSSEFRMRNQHKQV